MRVFAICSWAHSFRLDLCSIHGILHGTSIDTHGGTYVSVLKNSSLLLSLLKPRAYVISFCVGARLLNICFRYMRASVCLCMSVFV